MHQNRFRLGLRPRPRRGSLRRSPRPSSRMGRGIPPRHTLPHSAPMARRPSRLRRSSRRLRRLDPSAPRSSRLRRSAASQKLKPTLLLPSGAATANLLQPAGVLTQQQSHVESRDEAQHRLALKIPEFSYNTVYDRWEEASTMPKIRKIRSLGLMQHRL